MANVLAVAAAQLGDPVSDLVLVKPFDRALHDYGFTTTRSATGDIVRHLALATPLIALPM